jgi:MYXO-CTERM domain-containing protein
MKLILRTITAATLVTLAAGIAHAQQAVELQQNAQDLLPSGSYADNWYVGGWAGNSYTSGPITGYPSFPVAGPGPNLGFTFSSNAVVWSAGTNAGKFENLPTDPVDSNTQALTFSALGGAGTTDAINFAGGFTGLTFNYSLGNNNSAYDQTADIWSGLNGTGTVVGTVSLTSAANTITATNRANIFTTWSTATNNSLTGVGQSITFGVANPLPAEEVELDAFTVQSTPEPTSYALGLTAAALFFLLRRRTTRA